ncbi:MAG TPA: TonB-dependent receptor [Caulobacterales bacterium]|nr:TonB-dependent receptor [Caulobacterales bacterium]
MRGSPNARRLRLLTGVAGSFAVMFAGGLAYAQDTSANATAQEDTGDTIVVTGFRASLRSSTATKRNADAIVESVTAEEIGKLPDSSIAESLARLPGLSAQRLFGRSQQISVRGLSPDFTTALLNGREQVSAGDNRGVEFDQYPSELLQSVVVYKTPTAGLIGQGLAGTADMRTVRPLSYDSRVIAMNARYEWDELGALVAGSDESGYRVTASYIDQSADRRWGWALGVADMSSPTQAERFESWGYPTGNSPPDFPTGNPLPNNVFVIGGAKPYVQSSTLERTGYLGVLEFRPNNNFSTRIDAFYSEFDERQSLKGIEIPLWWDCSSGCGWRMDPSYTVSNNLVTDATFATEGVVRNDVRTRHSEVTAIGWNGRYDANDHWSFEADLSYSRVKRDDLDLETYAGTGPGNGAGAAGGADDILGVHQGNGSWVFDSSMDYTDYSLIQLTDPQGWGQAGFIKRPQTDDELDALRVTAERHLDNGPFSSWEFGINYSERSKDHTSLEHFVDLNCGGSPPTFNNCSVPVPMAFRQGPTSLAFIGIAGQISFDPEALLNDGGVYTLRELLNSDVIVKTWGVDENVLVAYTQLNIDSSLGAHSLKGNVGIQFVNTEQESTGGVQTGPTVSVADVTESYLEMLPSLNLSYEVMDNSYLRLGIARTLARPRMDEERASFAVSYNIGNMGSTNPSASYWGGSGGNPRLHPWIADSIDLSFEHYFGQSDGYVSLAAFYKKLESYIYTRNEVFDFTGFPLLNPGDTPATNLGVASVPVNGSGGYIQGLELTVSLPGEVIASALEGFGVVFNAASNDSDIHPPNTPGSALPGLSETVINTTVYYERAGFEFRVSNRYRSDFLGEVTGFGAGRELRMVNGESIVDAQIGYRFEEGALQGLAIQFQANNITDEPFSTFVNGDDRLVRDYQRYGSTYLFGVSYRR